MNTKDLTKILLAQAESQVKALQFFQLAYDNMAMHYTGDKISGCTLVTCSLLRV